MNLCQDASNTRKMMSNKETIHMYVDEVVKKFDEVVRRILAHNLRV